MGSQQTEAAAATSSERSASASASASSGSQGSAAPSSSSGPRNHQGGPSTAATATPLEAVKISCLMNARYHAAREAFLDRVHRWFMFGIIATGAGAVSTAAGKLGAPSWLDVTFAAGAAILGALDLTFDLSNRARSHALMKRRYFELLADVTEERRKIPDAEACLHRYAADEEPAYLALLATSWNAAQEMIYGSDAQEYSISCWNRALKNIWRFEGKRYELKNKAI